MISRVVTVIRHEWAFVFGGRREPVIRIRMGERFLVIPIGEGRKVSDLIHDMCDEYESEQRANQ